MQEVCSPDGLQEKPECQAGNAGAGEDGEVAVVWAAEAVVFGNLEAVVGGEVDVTGMARRVPDIDRPHRFETTATARGVAGSRGAETSYKNMAADKEYMNVVGGVLQPLQWLRSMPSARGPQMQVVQGTLRQALLAQKPSVYRNFTFNETAMQTLHGMTPLRDDWHR